MKSLSLPRALAAFAVTAILSFPATAGACSICMGDVNSRSAPAMNDAIFLMLGCIGFMLSCLAAFGFYLFKRANAPLPPHATLGETMNSSEGASPLTHEA